MISLSELLAASEGFLTKFPDGSQVAWKLLSIKQYEALRGLVASGILSEPEARHEAFNLCSLERAEYFSQLPAGYVDAIGAMILWYSGDCNPTTLKNDLYTLKQAYTGGTPQEHMMTVILTAFQSLTLEEVEGWSRNKLLRTFVRAEHALAYRLGEGFTYLDPNDIQFAGEKSEKIGVDFDTEISEMRDQGLGTNPWVDDDDEEKLARWKKLTKEQARDLDRRR